MRRRSWQGARELCQLLRKLALKGRGGCLRSPPPLQTSPSPLQGGAWQLLDPGKTSPTSSVAWTHETQLYSVLKKREGCANPP